MEGKSGREKDGQREYKVREKGRDKNKNKNKNKYGERMSGLRNKDAKNKKLRGRNDFANGRRWTFHLYCLP